MTDTAFAHRPVQIALDQLELSPLNPRRAVDDDAVQALAESIAAEGLLQNLVVLAGHPFQVVAGGQRLRALRWLDDQGRAPSHVPCVVLETEAEAVAAALAENAARRDLSISDQIDEFAAMAERGRSPRDIAIGAGVTERLVRQRLKLASLPQPARDALRAGQITLDQAQALTLCTDPERLPALLDAAQSRMTPFQLRRAGTEGHPSVTDSRVTVVGLQAYLDAGGTLIEDLFEDDSRIEDPALLDDLFADRCRAQAQALRDQGWLWAEYIGFGAFYMQRPSGLTRIFPASRNAEDLPEFTAEQRAVAGVHFTFDRDGRLRLDGEAYIRPQDADSARAFGVIDPPRAADSTTPDEAEADEPGITRALAQDLAAVELHSVQARLADDPGLALDLAALILSTLSPRFQPVLAVTTGPTKNAPAVADGFAPAPWLASAEDYAPPRTDLVQAWQNLTGGNGDTDLVLARAIAARLHHGRDGNPLWPMLVATLAPNPRDFWTPTEANCFARVRSAQLDLWFADLIGKPPTHPVVIAFASRKKAEKAKMMHLIFNSTPAQRRGIHGWSDVAEAALPGWWPGQMIGGQA